MKVKVGEFKLLCSAAKPLPRPQNVLLPEVVQHRNDREVLVRVALRRHERPQAVVRGAIPLAAAQERLQCHGMTITCTALIYYLLDRSIQVGAYHPLEEGTRRWMGYTERKDEFCFPPVARVARLQISCLQLSSLPTKSLTLLANCLTSPTLVSSRNIWKSLHYEQSKHPEIPTV